MMRSLVYFAAEKAAQIRDVANDDTRHVSLKAAKLTWASDELKVSGHETFIEFSIAAQAIAEVEIRFADVGDDSKTEAAVLQGEFRGK